MYYRDKKCDKWGSNSRLYDYEAYALPTAPLSLPSLWCISEVMEPCTLMRHSGIKLLSSYLLCCFWLAFVFSSSLYYCDKKCDNWGWNSRPYDYETYALPTAPLSLSPLWCISEVIGTLYVDAAFRNNCCQAICAAFGWLLFFLSSLYYCSKNLRQVRIELTTLRLWDSLAAVCAIVAVSFVVNQWRYWSLVRWCGIPEWQCCRAIFCAAFGRLWFFASNMYYRDKKCDKWGSNSQLHDYEAYALPTAPLSLPSLWCISEVLEPCTLMRHSGITLLSSYLLCCFWLALVFSLPPVLLWQKVRQVRIELTTLRLRDRPSEPYYCNKNCDKWGSNSHH